MYKFVYFIYLFIIDVELLHLSAINNFINYIKYKVKKILFRT